MLALIGTRGTYWVRICDDGETRISVDSVTRNSLTTRLNQIKLDWIKFDRIKLDRPSRYAG